MEEESRSSPRVHLPPPLILIVAFLAGVALDALVSLPLFPSDIGVAWSVLPWLLTALGSALMLWGLLTFVRARTGVIPFRPATQLVTHGPYRFSRNPMYAGLSIAYVGFSIWVDSFWPLLMLPLALWVLWKVFIEREEAYLASTFGEAYEAYRSRVRRWL